MKKFRRIAAFILCFIVIAAMSVTAYAIGAKALGTVNFRSAANTNTSTIYGQFTLGEIFRIQQGVYDTDNILWWYGYPDIGTALYNHYGYAIRGYSRSIDKNGDACFTFDLT